MERADVQAAADGEFVQDVAAGQHPRPVQREHRVQRTGRRVHRKGRQRVTAEDPGPQRIQVGAVIGMPVADEHRVEEASAEQFQQPRHDRIAKVEQQPEPVVFHQVTAARRAFTTFRTVITATKACQHISHAWRNGVY